MSTPSLTLKNAGLAVTVRVGQTVVMTDGTTARVMEIMQEDKTLRLERDGQKWFANNGLPPLGPICAQIDLAATLAAQRAGAPVPADVAPIDMLLFCPKCGMQHVDAPELDKGWTNPPHKSHLCHGCGCIWRPADVSTNGIALIETTGKHDTWSLGVETHYLNSAPDVEAIKKAAYKRGWSDREDDLLLGMQRAGVPTTQRGDGLRAACEALRDKWRGNAEVLEALAARPSISPIVAVHYTSAATSRSSCAADLEAALAAEAGRAHAAKDDGHD